jgi:hypothetical protein
MPLAHDAEACHEPQLFDRIAEENIPDDCDQAARDSEKK